jgi:L-fuconolactonase
MQTNSGTKPNQTLVTRRRFLQAASGLSLLPLAGCATGAWPQEEGIVDTHTHFYDPTRPQGVPWPPKDDAVLYRSVLPDEFERLARPLGVTGTVVVEASAWLEDNQWVLDLAARERIIVGLVGHLKPGRPGFEQDLARFAAQPLFRGIRTGLWGVTMAPDEPEFVRDLGRLAERDLALDVLVGPEQLDVVSRLATAVPDLRMVVDHCANVRIDGRPPPEVWVAGMRGLTRHRNVHMKVSGLVEGSGRVGQHAPAELPFYCPVLDVIWEALGEDRVIYGSNWPVSTRFADYATVLRIVTAYFQAKGAGAARKYFRQNAARVYKFVSR